MTASDGDTPRGRGLDRIEGFNARSEEDLRKLSKMIADARSAVSEPMAD